MLDRSLSKAPMETSEPNSECRCGVGDGEQREILRWGGHSEVYFELPAPHKISRRKYSVYAVILTYGELPQMKAIGAGRENSVL